MEHFLDFAAHEHTPVGYYERSETQITETKKLRVEI